MSFLFWGIVCVLIGLRWGMSSSSAKVRNFIISTERRIREKLSKS